MRKIKTIVKLVANSGLYVDYDTWLNTEPSDTSYFLCDCLDSALDVGLITPDEAEKARAAIGEYIYNRFSLARLLMENGLPHDHAAKMAIWNDWANRPKLEAPCPR